MSDLILIIEDDEDTVEAMRLVLEKQGYRVQSREDPEEGFAAALADRPDLIILDVMFGEGQATQGFDYAIKMKQNEALAPIPILMITSVNQRYLGFRFSDKTDGEYLPVDAFIDKPALPKELLGKVETLLAQKTSKWQHWPEVTNDSNG